MAEITKHYLISGRVQGVGFRAFALRSALELGLRGWVRNLDDGRVEAMAQGSSELLMQFAQCLRQGPPHGQVDSLTIEDWPMEFHEGFTMREDGTKPCSKD